MLTDSVAKRLPDWWVAKTKPAQTLRFAKYLEAEYYLPTDRHGRPAIGPYVFIRAVGQPNAWMCPGFSGWLQLNGHRSIVSEQELAAFRELVTSSAAQDKRAVHSRGIILKINGNTEIRAHLA